MGDHHLAHLDLGRLNAELDAESMAEFRLALNPIDAIAEATPGARLATGRRGRGVVPSEVGLPLRVPLPPPVD